MAREREPMWTFQQVQEHLAANGGDICTVPRGQLVGWATALASPPVRKPGIGITCKVCKRTFRRRTKALALRATVEHRVEHHMEEPDTALHLQVTFRRRKARS